MADDVTHTSTSPAGPPDGTKQVTDEHATRGHMPVVKLAIATDGSATLIPADGTDGLLVNLGANNDVTVSGTVTANTGLSQPLTDAQLRATPVSVSGTFYQATQPVSATQLPAAIAANGGMKVEGVAGGVAVPVSSTQLPSALVSGRLDVSVGASLPAGTAYVGKTRITDGTTDLSVDTSWADAESNTQNHLDVGAFNMIYNGTTWDRARGDTTNGIDVDVTRVSGSVAVTDNAGSLTVDAPVATPVFVRLSDGAAAISTLPVSATQLPAALAANGGLKIEGVASGVAVPVSLASVPSHAVTNAGTFAVQVDGSALTSLQLIDDPVFADDSAFTIATSKVMMAGGAVVAHGSNPDAADAGDAGALLMNRHRVQFVIGGHPNTVTLKHTTITTAVTDAAIVTVSAGTKIVVTRLSVTLDSASTVFPTVLIGFGTANTPTTTGVLASHGGVPAGGGFTIGDGSGILGIGADNEDLRVTTTGNATGNGLQITVSYYTIES